MAQPSLSDNRLRLKDKVAIVTGAGCVGAGWGNGRATAVRFVEEGAKVFAVDRDAAALKARALERIAELERETTLTESK